MFGTTRSRRLIAGGFAAAVAGVLGMSGASAGAEPDAPVVPPQPAPVTVTQTVTVAPAAAGPAGSTAAPVAGTPVAPQAAVPAQPALVPATSGTLREYFQEKGVQLEAQDPRTFQALHITLPMPAGWSRVPDPNVPDAFAVIANRGGGDGLYTPNAQVVIYKLVGDFDPREAITHGFIDSQQLTNWQTTSASLDEFGGFPSSLISGAYRDNDLGLNTTQRHVIASAGPDKYLVTLSVSSSVGQAVANAEATDAILNGFKVTDPTAHAPAAPAAPATPTVAPAAPVAAPAVPVAAPAVPAVPVAQVAPAVPVVPAS